MSKILKLVLIHVVSCVAHAALMNLDDHVVFFLSGRVKVTPWILMHVLQIMVYIYILIHVNTMYIYTREREKMHEHATLGNSSIQGKKSSVIPCCPEERLAAPPVALWLSQPRGPCFRYRSQICAHPALGVLVMPPVFFVEGPKFAWSSQTCKLDAAYASVVTLVVGSFQDVFLPLPKNWMCGAPICYIHIFRMAQPPSRQLATPCFDASESGAIPLSLNLPIVPKFC